MTLIGVKWLKYKYIPQISLSDFSNQHLQVNHSMLPKRLTVSKIPFKIVFYLNVSRVSLSLAHNPSPV